MNRPERAGQARARRARNLGLWLAAAPILLFLAVPTAVVVPMSLTPRNYLEFPPSGLSLHSFRDVARDSEWTAAALTSLQVAGIAVVVAGLAGCSAAVALHRRRFLGRGLIGALLLLPIVMPLVVLGLADFLFFSKFGLVGTVVGIGLAHSVLAAPYVYLTVESSLAGLNPSLVRAAQSLGAGSLSLFRHVYLPVIVPGVLAGSALAFAVSFDEAVISLFLQGPDATTLAVKMFTDIQYELTPKIAAVASLLVGVTSAALMGYAAVRARRGRRPSTPVGGHEGLVSER